MAEYANLKRVFKRIIVFTLLGVDGWSSWVLLFLVYYSLEILYFV